jgi:hypothetical protein
MAMPTRNLGLDLMRATEAAALASARFVGRGDKEGGDRAAVEAMRLLLNSLDFRGRVVIGEGEKDQAPMLYNGEVLGQGDGPLWDLAVDPVEGTRLLALGRPGAISVIAAAPEGALFNPGPAFYAAKLVVGPEAREAIDLKASVADNLKEIAKALKGGAGGYGLCPGQAQARPAHRGDPLQRGPHHPPDRRGRGRGPGRRPPGNGGGRPHGHRRHPGRGDRRRGGEGPGGRDADAPGPPERGGAVAPGPRRL